MANNIRIRLSLEKVMKWIFHIIVIIIIIKQRHFEKMYPFFPYVRDLTK